MELKKDWSNDNVLKIKKLKVKKSVMCKHQFPLAFRFFEASNTWSLFIYHHESPFHMILISLKLL